MKTMLAAFLPGNSSVELREVPVPTPGINQVLIKMKSSGICGSDVHYIYHQHRGTAAAPDKPEVSTVTIKAHARAIVRELPGRRAERRKNRWDLYIWPAA